MQSFKIPVTWIMTAEITLEANSLDEAIRKANNSKDPLPAGEYLDGSFCVDEDVVRYDD